MNIFISLAIIILSALTQSFFQVSLGTLLLLYHSSLGKHIKKKTRCLASSFIAGVGILTFLLLCASCYILIRCFDAPINTNALIVFIGIIVFLSILVWLFYYRKSESTELWLPKSVAHFINTRAKSTESNTESFSLGAVACFAELPFTIVLLFISSNSILELPPILQLPSIALYTTIAILPLLIMRFSIKSGKTVVDIQRWRQKNKRFFKIICAVSFLALALFVFAFKVFGVA